MQQALPTQPSAVQIQDDIYNLYCKICSTSNHWHNAQQATDKASELKQFSTLHNLNKSLQAYAQEYPADVLAVGYSLCRSMAKESGKPWLEHVQELGFMLAPAIEQLANDTMTVPLMLQQCVS